MKTIILSKEALENLKVAKKRCLNCKKYNKTEDALKVNISYFCDMECAVTYANKPTTIKKGKDIKHKQQKKAYSENKLSTRKRAAKEACHAYIRLRDKDKPCICCGEPLGDDFHAGHFWESGNYSFLRYDEDNIHGQRSSCNTFKGGDSGFYRENLIKRIGLESVQWLDSNRSNKVKRNAQDYIAIERYFKEKIKEIEAP